MNNDAYTHAVERLHSTITWQTHNYMGSHADSLSFKEQANSQQFYLDRSQYMLDALGNPEKAGYKVVHVAGTSGKGSTSMMMYESLRAANQTVGLFMSPYVTTPLENIQINGSLADVDGFVEAVHHVVDIAEKIKKKKPEFTPSYSELFYAIALVLFEANGVEWVVLETGCGGRFDYTRTMPDSSVAATIITPIAIDHVSVLGDTIEQIAWHKAGIIRQRTPIITCQQPAEAMKMITREAKATNNEIAIATPSDEYTPALLGPHQLQNAAMVGVAGYILGIPNEALQAGISAARLPARMEIIQEYSKTEPLVIVDGAHSVAKMEALVHTLANASTAEHPLHTTGRTIAILSMKEGKQVEPMLRVLAPVIDHAIITEWTLPGFSSISAAEMTTLCTQLGISTQIAPHMEVAIQSISEHTQPKDRVIITGSLYGAGFARTHWISEKQILQSRSLFQ